jgi:CRISPR-associated endonuclease/helicase Cas3
MIKQAYAHNGITGDQPLDEHLHGVSRRCSQYARKIGLPLTGALIGLLHDLGKSSEIFQTYLRSFAPGSGIEPQDELRGKIDHSTAGAQCLVRNLPGAENQASLGGLVARLLGLCIASHHSGLIDCLTPNGEDGLTRRLEKKNSATRYAEAWASIAPGVRVEAERLLHSPELIEEVRRMLSQLLQGPVSGDRAMQLGLMARLLLSCLIDADRTDTSDFEKSHSAKLRQHGRYVKWAELLQRLESGLSRLPSSGAVNEERQRISEECAASASRPRGIYTLTVPTGGGKTLAALRFALRHAQLQTGNGEGGASRGIDRVIFVSPYISIVEQNAAVVRAFLEPEDAEASSVVLEHHSNLAEERDERAGNEHWRRKVLAENWDAPIVFTTMVQVLEALFGGGTRAVRRLHAMAGTVLVFDEVQTMPVRMVHLFNNAINLLSTHCGATILLCTATQPLLGRVNKARGSAQMAATPELISDVAGTFRALRRYVVTDSTKRVWTRHEVAQLARRAVAEHGSCLVIVNAKRDAREIFRLCQTGR